MSASREILIAARERYAESPSHAKGGEPVEDGTYCIVTALSPKGWCWEEIKLMRGIAQTSLVEFNATHTTEEVLDLFDRAIKEAA